MGLHGTGLSRLGFGNASSTTPRKPAVFAILTPSRRECKAVADRVGYHEQNGDEQGRRADSQPLLPLVGFRIRQIRDVELIESLQDPIPHRVLRYVHPAHPNFSP
jgi:hypothetical protein